MSRPSPQKPPKPTAARAFDLSAALLSAGDESFSAGRLEYPQWTRPAEWKGQVPPPVLLSGDHAAIARWRRRASVRLTQKLRPDLLAAHPLTEEEQKLLSQEPSDDEPDAT